ncbi:hypothetical protein PAERUG_P47_London_12_VIM_2_12_12_00019 [Pseudomonas aeruginosa]|nr:hypothetical protein PAERUG_P47_London_12_VIM_2_12_12_00019 [Pseudomonas aeruginosa]
MCIRDRGAAPFRQHRGAGRALHAPVEAVDEPEHQGDVAQVGGQQDRQWRPCVLRAEEPADQCVAGQGRRQAEQAGMEEGAGLAGQFRRRLHQLQGPAAQGQGQRAEQQGQEQRHAQALGEDQAQRAAIVAAGGLGGEAGGAHAQEAEHADHQGVQAAAHGYRAELVGVRQVADHRAVHQVYQGNGNVRQNHRPGQRPDPVVGRGVAPGIAQQAHGVLRIGRAV